MKLEILDQWSTRIPRPTEEGSKVQRVDCNWTLLKITRQPFWKRHSWKSWGSCLQPQRTCIWNLKRKFQSKLELRCQNHVAYKAQKPKNLIWPPGSHLENKVNEINRLLLIYTSIGPLKLRVQIQSQTKVRVWKPKNPIWLPHGHFEIKTVENQ